MKVAIVGAGLSGATLAVKLKGHHQVTVLERRHFVGGMAYTERDDATGIIVHKFGPHIFHTKNPRVKRFMEHFGEWVPFDLRTKTYADGRVYSGPPINLATINEFFGETFTPEDAKKFMEPLVAPYLEGVYADFEEAALARVGWDLYEAFLKGYTEKQWGRPCTDIPASVLARLNINYSYDDSRFSGEWQAMPRQGYTEVVKRMLDGITVKTRTDVHPSIVDYYDHTFWTAPLDEFYLHEFGPLEYRTLDFEEVRLETADAQGTPIMCYPGTEQFTRITEHRHLAPWPSSGKGTIVTVETPRACGPGDTPFYPVETTWDQLALTAYRAQAAKEPKVTFLGRLGKYKYMNMDQAVGEALECATQFLLRSS